MKGLSASPSTTGTTFLPALAISISMKSGRRVKLGFNPAGQEGVPISTKAFGAAYMQAVINAARHGRIHEIERESRDTTTIPKPVKLLNALNDARGAGLSPGPTSRRRWASP